MLHYLIDNLSHYSNYFYTCFNSGCKHLLSQFATFLFHQTQFPFNDSVSIEIIDWNTLRLTDILIDTERIKKNLALPFIVSRIWISTVTVIYNEHVTVVVDKVELVANLSDFRKEYHDTSSSKHSTSSSPYLSHPIQQNNFEEEGGTLVVNDIRDAQQVIADYIDNIFQTAKITINDISVTTISDISMSNVEKHTMTLHMNKIHNRSFTHWTTSDITFKIYPTRPAAIISSFDISFNGTDGILIADFSETENIRFSMCGDSGFILSMFIQQLLENQRLVDSKSNGDEVDQPNYAQVHEEHVSKLIAKNVAETMTQYILDDSSDNAAETQKPIPILRGIKCRNLNFTLDIFKGSDANGNRFFQIERNAMTTGHFTFKGWGGYLEYSLQQEFLVASVNKVQTTIGYVDNTITMKMRHSYGGFWNVMFDIPDVYVRTSQSIIDKMIVLFNFNGIWNEYDLLYNQGDSIKFKTVDISDVNVRFKYYNAPIDYNKVLRGNWKHVAKLIPHCDLSITLPNIILRYQIGWEDVIDAYIKELLTTQKIRCIKKVIYSTAKRKIKDIFVRK